MLNKISLKSKIQGVCFVLIMAIVIALVPLISTADSNPQDVTEKVTFDSFDFYKTDMWGNVVPIITKGAAVDPVPALKQKDTIGLKYYWSISKDNMANVTKGSFFVVDLPKDISFKNTSDAANIYAGDDETVIGKMTLTGSAGNQKLTVTLNEAGAGATSLDEGWLKISGSVDQSDDSSDTITVFSVSVPIVTQTSGGNAGNNTGDLKDKSNYGWGEYKGKDLQKSVYTYDEYTGKTRFNIAVNEDMYINKFEGNPEYKVRKNVIVEDRLQEGVTYAGNFRVYTPPLNYVLGVNTTNAALDPVIPIKMSSDYFKHNMDMANKMHMITPTDPAISYGEFRQLIKDSGPLTYGIWQNKGIVVNLGDLEGQLPLGDITWSQLKERIDSGHREVTNQIYERTSTGDVVIDPATGEPKDPQTVTFEAITPEIKELTKKAYASFFGVPENGIDDPGYDNNTGKAVGVYISFEAMIRGDSRTVTNTAVMEYNDEKSVSSQTKVDYVRMSGGAKFGTAVPGDVRLTKLDADTGELLAGVKFILKKYNKATGEYEEIPDGTRGSGVFETGTNGAIIFHELEWGKYKVVEKEGLEGYLPKVSFKDDKDTFDLIDPDKVIEITAYNYKVEESTVPAIEEPTAPAVEEPTVPAIQGEEATPDAITTDGSVAAGSVMGESATPDSTTDTGKTGSVLGQEAKTSDVTNLIPILLAMLAVLILMLIATLFYKSKND